MRIIILMLDKLGLTTDKESVENAWTLFLKDTEAFKPNDYSLLFPQKLLQLIVDEFFTFYQNADLASYPELLKAGNNSVAQLLNNAWSNAKASPLEYYSYETGSINKLRNEFGMETI